MLSGHAQLAQCPSLVLESEEGEEEEGQPPPSDPPPPWSVVSPVYRERSSGGITWRSLMAWVHRMVEQRVGRGYICTYTVSPVHLEGSSGGHPASTDPKTLPELRAHYDPDSHSRCRAIRQKGPRPNPNPSPRVRRKLPQGHN